MRGFTHLLSSVSLESLLGNSAWFSQSLMRNHHTSAAFGQVGLEGRGARINWLLPLEADSPDVLPALLDNLALQSALRGCYCLLGAARADEDLFRLLRCAGFFVYGWQRIWQVFGERFPNMPAGAFDFTWAPPEAADSLEISALRKQLLSPSSQTVRKLTGDKLPQYILKVNGEIRGVARVNGFGGRVMVVPLLAQTPFEPLQLLQPLFARLLPTHPTAYLLQTAELAGWEGVLSEMAEPVCDREELLVKHFTSIQKVPLGVLNGASTARHVDTISPIVKSEIPPDTL